MQAAEVMATDFHAQWTQVPPLSLDAQEDLRSEVAIWNSVGHEPPPRAELLDVGQHGVVEAVAARSHAMEAWVSPLPLVGQEVESEAGIEISVVHDSPVLEASLEEVDGGFAGVAGRHSYDQLIGTPVRLTDTQDAALHDVRGLKAETQTSMPPLFLENAASAIVNESLVGVDESDVHAGLPVVKKEANVSFYEAPRTAPAEDFKVKLHAKRKEANVFLMNLQK